MSLANDGDDTAGDDVVGEGEARTSPETGTQAGAVSPVEVRKKPLGFRVGVS
jgi:hypothetical protein